MTNARCLTEGVDVPAIDCVLFADPKHSTVDIVQATGRALRRFARPLLVFPSINDKINPPGPTLRRTRRCKSATIVTLQCEHMEIGAEPYRGRIVSSTREFLRDCLPLREIH